MSVIMLREIFFLVLIFNLSNCHVSYQPEQVHLSYGDNKNEIVVTWSTINDTKESIVEYGIGGFVLRATGSATLFTDGGPEKHSQYIHRVKLSGLTPSSKYGKFNKCSWKSFRNCFFFFVSISLWK